MTRKAFLLISTGTLLTLLLLALLEVAYTPEANASMLQAVLLSMGVNFLWLLGGSVVYWLTSFPSKNLNLSFIATALLFSSFCAHFGVDEQTHRAVGAMFCVPYLGYASYLGYKARKQS